MTIRIEETGPANRDRRSSGGRRPEWKWLTAIFLSFFDRSTDTDHA